MCFAVRNTAIIALMVMVMLLGPGCLQQTGGSHNPTTGQEPEATSQPMPTSSPASDLPKPISPSAKGLLQCATPAPKIEELPMWVPYIMLPVSETALLASDTVVIGRITKELTSAETSTGSPLPGGIQTVQHRDWDLEVEAYVVKPLPCGHLKVRTWESPTGKIISLLEGEHVLLFLSREEDHFVMGTGLTCDHCKYPIKSGKVKIVDYGSTNAAWERWVPLDEFVRKIKSTYLSSLDDSPSTQSCMSVSESRKTNLLGIAFQDEGIKSYFANKKYDLQIWSYSTERLPYEVRYLLEFTIPDGQIVLLVNATRRTIENIYTNLRGQVPLTVGEQEQALHIALTDRDVKALIGDSMLWVEPGALRGFSDLALLNPEYFNGYNDTENVARVLEIRASGWHETCNGRTNFFVAPMVRILTGSYLLDIFVDTDHQNVMKILKFNQ